MEKEEYLQVGIINKPVGLKGEFKIYVTSSFKDDRLAKGNALFLFLNGKYLEIKVEAHRAKDDKFDVLKLEGYDDIASIEDLYEQPLFILKNSEELPKDSYFYSDLIGCILIDQDGKEVAKVASIEEFPSQITLKIVNSDRKIGYLPFNDFFIKKVDIADKKIYVHLIEGII
jgi:16S rRNA processing protein RimM